MGGSNETRLPGSDNLRIHESGGDVHVHDDVRGTKFFMPTKQFKKEYSQIKKVLQSQKPPYQAFMNDHNNVRLVGELDNDQIEWRLETGKLGPLKGTEPVPALAGFDELDGFIGSI